MLPRPDKLQSAKKVAMLLIGNTLYTGITSMICFIYQNKSCVQALKHYTMNGYTASAASCFKTLKLSSKNYTLDQLSSLPVI
jgi:hypothetical protein